MNQLPRMSGDWAKLANVGTPVRAFIDGYAQALDPFPRLTFTYRPAHNAVTALMSDSMALANDSISLQYDSIRRK